MQGSSPLDCPQGSSVWKIGAAVEPQVSVGLLSLCLIPGTQERAQRRSCLCTKCTDELSEDVGPGRKGR